MDKLPEIVTVSITMDGFMLGVDEGASDRMLEGKLLNDGVLLGWKEG